MKAVLSLSGGLDSAVLLARAIAEKRDVLCIGFRYGSKHNFYENQAAWRIAYHYQLPYRLIDISSVMCSFKSDLLLTGGAIPEGHYEEETMKRTVVPGRNIIFLSILAGLAMSEGMDEVWIGVHSGDHAIYPDCRPDFLNHMRLAVLYGTDHKVMICSPFQLMTKADIVKEGLERNVPFNITRTCYKDQLTACGLCGSCQERLQAFQLNNVEDPIQYEVRDIMEKKK